MDSVVVELAVCRLARIVSRARRDRHKGLGNSGDARATAGRDRPEALAPSRVPQAIRYVMGSVKSQPAAMMSP